MSRNNFFLISIFVLMSCAKEKEKVQRAVSYHKNGQLAHQVLLNKNGEPEGLGVNYYESGKVKSETYWKNGKKHGKSTFYYEDGKLQQVSEYKLGIPLRVEDYTEDGHLKQVTIYDSRGRIFDYYNYKKDGTRDFNYETKDPIFIPEKDTVSVGENYVAAIRLGNRQYSHVDVIIGDPGDPEIIKKNKPLPKKDSLTSILNIKADSAGPQEISGVVFERNQKWDSMDVTPFTHRFYVKPPERQKSI